MIVAAGVCQVHKACRMKLEYQPMRFNNSTDFRKQIVRWKKSHRWAKNRARWADLEIPESVFVFSPFRLAYYFPLSKSRDSRILSSGFHLSAKRDITSLSETLADFRILLQLIPIHSDFFLTTSACLLQDLSSLENMINNQNLGICQSPKSKDILD